MTAAAKLIINLQAIVHNWKILRRKLDCSVTCGAVVKADGYGLGMLPVAEALHSAGCRLFFVATLHEGKILRNCLSFSDVDIIVLGGLSHDIEQGGCSSDWSEYHLIPVLFSIEHVTRWCEYCDVKSVVLPYVLKLDSGMGRLGLSPEELQQCLMSSEQPLQPPLYFMSHLACADTPQHPMNQKQMLTFGRCVESLKQYFPETKISLANSAGIFLDEKAHFDAVRPGCALYGVNPTSYAENPMLPVVSLHLPVMQVKTLLPGDSVGYGAEFVAEEEMLIAIIFGGYADGVFRYLGGKGSVFFERESLPIVGRISMDSFAVSLGALSKQQQESIQFVEMLGLQQTVDDVAAQAGTIGYEVLTNLGQRFERSYLPFTDEVVN